MSTKKCSECNIVKNVEEFFKDKGFKDGYYSRCKICKTNATLVYRAKKKDKYNEYMRKYRHEHPETEAAKTKSKRKSLKSRYGITQNEKIEMLESQGGSCALCDLKPTDREFHVDHCHRTGRFRGVLCPGHNRSIAILDDLDLLRKAIAYTGARITIMEEE